MAAKCNAYILAADPAWIEASVRSYYPLVDRIVVSYDEDSLGWTGKPLDVEQCLRRLRAIDPEGKFDYRPGNYSRSAFYESPMDNDTYQRQVALDQASDGAEWVLQLDTDEVIGDTSIFADCLGEAHRQGCQALNYPSLWLYSHAFGHWYLEWCDRGWRRAPGYPGPMAVRPDNRLILARRIERGHFHVDLSKRGSSGRVPNGIEVDRVIKSSAAISHFSMLRDEEWLRRKFISSSHATDRNWNPEVEGWLWARKHPFLKVLLSQLDRGAFKRPLRLNRVPSSVASLIAASCVSDFRTADAQPAAA